MEALKNRYRLYRRGKTFYWQDNESVGQGSLRTKNRAEAEKLLHAKNESRGNPSINLKMAEVYLSAHDPRMVKRTWADVIEQMIEKGTAESTKTRCRRAFASSRFEKFRDKVVVHTTAEDLLSILNGAGNSTIHYLRRLHNLAVDLGWLPWPALPKAQWPKVISKRSRAITADEHAKIVGSERNQEKRDYYEYLWHTGASQSDAAEMTGDKIDWRNGLLIYQRKKLANRGGFCSLQIGSKFRQLLERLPRTGPLFPTLATAGSSARTTEFKRRCRIAGISGVTLHSYRYSWAARARQALVPLRLAQAALGHGTRAIHEAYAGGDVIIAPSLEDYESEAARKIIPMATMVSDISDAEIRRA